MIYRPKRIKKTHIVLPLVLIIGGIICLGFSYADFVFMPSILQILGFVCFTAAIILIGRFSVIEYEYEIGKENFRVTKIQGKKYVDVAFLSLDCLSAVHPKTKGFSIKDKIPQKIRLIQNCSVNIFPEAAFYLVFDTEDGIFVLQVELCEEMYFELERILRDKKQ